MPANNTALTKDDYPGVTTHMTDTSQAISDHVMIYLHIYITIVTGIIVSVSGIATNILSIVIFYKLGLKDSMSVGVFSLSITDLIITSVQLASCLCYVLHILCPNLSADTMHLGYYELGWVITAMNEVSCWITAMISVERCYCVVSPFKVKQVFTRRRCIIVTLTIYVIHIGIHIPIYIKDSPPTREIIAPLEASTTQVYQLPAHNDQGIRLVDFILDLTAGASMWLCSQAVIIVCAVWMGYSLEASSKVRHHSNHEFQCLNSSKRSSTLSNRERRLVKVVLFLAIALTCCNVPKMITTTVYYAYPGTNTGKQENLSTLLWSLAYMCGSVGCNITFLVYINLNPNYRRQLKDTFTCGTDTDTFTCGTDKFTATKSNI